LSMPQRRGSEPRFNDEGREDDCNGDGGDHDGDDGDDDDDDDDGDGDDDDHDDIAVSIGNKLSHVHAQC